jgi:hypothetical protein
MHPMKRKLESKDTEQCKKPKILSDNPLIGKKIGSYQIEELLADGSSTADVFRARHEETRQPFAIKVFRVRWEHGKPIMKASQVEYWANAERDTLEDLKRKGAFTNASCLIHYEESTPAPVDGSCEAAICST